jgi:hypothetical protein
MKNNLSSPNILGSKFASTLLATTCLAVIACSRASAQTTIIEGTSPAPSDFPDTFVGFVLPFGTTTVQGSLSSKSDFDFFEFQGLQANTSFSITGIYNPHGQESGTSFAVFDSSHSSFGSVTLEGSGGTVSGIIPSDGLLAVQVQEGASRVTNYQFDLTAATATVPEPADSALVGSGLALAGALVWRKKRAQKQ